jgi:ATP synthase protein I
MDDFSAHLKTVQTIFMFFLSFCLAGWALAADYRPYFAGLMLGSVTSLINSRHLAWKVGRFTELALAQRGGKRFSLGFLTRGALAVLACAVALRYPHLFAFWTTLAGLFFAQLATLILGIVAIYRQRR